MTPFILVCALIAHFILQGIDFGLTAYLYYDLGWGEKNPWGAWVFKKGIGWAVVYKLILIGITFWVVFYFKEYGQSFLILTLIAWPLIIAWNLRKIFGRW